MAEVETGTNICYNLQIIIARYHLKYIFISYLFGVINISIIHYIKMAKLKII